MSTAPAKLSYAGKGGGFWDDLEAAVDAYVTPRVEQKARRQLHRKAIIIMAWWVLSYLALILFASQWWLIAPLCLSLLLACAAAAFSISHDGNHGGFSRHQRVNSLAGLVLDALGGSSFTWKVKHNRAHHTYPNIVGYDDDLDAPPAARFASDQPYKWWYRGQHIYLWLMYCVVTTRWLVWGDFEGIFRNRIGRFNVVPPIKADIGWRRLDNRLTRSVWRFTVDGRLKLFGRVVAWKLFFGAWALGLPLYLHSEHWRAVLVIYAVTMAIFSFLLTITFQLAHCTDEAEFTSEADAKSGKFPNAWAEQQVLATVDFCPNNRVLTWFLGGLNFQVIHHLFMRRPHTLYPEIAKIVGEVCARHGLEYKVHQRLSTAVWAHVKHIYRMGQPPARPLTQTA